MKSMTGCLLGLTLLLCGPAAYADELADAQKQIVDKWDGTKSITAKVAKKANIEARDNKIRNEGTGTYEMLREGGKVFWRLETKVDMAIAIKGQDKDMKLSQETLLVDDGENLWNMTKSMGGPNVRKSKSNVVKGEPENSSDRKAFFDALNRDNTVKLQSAARVDSVDCFVLEAAPKVMRNGLPAKTVYSFAKDTGMLMKVVKVNEKGDEYDTTSYSDVKANEKIDPARFKFTPPEGVRVTDDSARPAPPIETPPAPPVPPTPAPSTQPKPSCCGAFGKMTCDAVNPWGPA